MGLTTILVVDVTVKLTGTVTEPTPEETSTVALCVPTARVPGLAVTRIEPGVLPLAGLIDNQDPPEAEAVKVIVLLLLLVTDRVCEEGTVPPCW